MNPDELETLLNGMGVAPAEGGDLDSALDAMGVAPAEEAAPPSAQLIPGQVSSGVYEDYNKAPSAKPPRVNWRNALQASQLGQAAPAPPVVQPGRPELFESSNYVEVPEPVQRAIGQFEADHPVVSAAARLPFNMASMDVGDTTMLGGTLAEGAYDAVAPDWLQGILGTEPGVQSYEPMEMSYNPASSLAGTLAAIPNTVSNVGDLLNIDTPMSDAGAESTYSAFGGGSGYRSGERLGQAAIGTGFGGGAIAQALPRAIQPLASGALGGLGTSAAYYIPGETDEQTSNRLLASGSAGGVLGQAAPALAAGARRFNEWAPARYNVRSLSSRGIAPEEIRQNYQRYPEEMQMAADAARQNIPVLGRERRYNAGVELRDRTGQEMAALSDEVGPIASIGSRPVTLNLLREWRSNPDSSGAQRFLKSILGREADGLGTEPARRVIDDIMMRASNGRVRPMDRAYQVGELARRNGTGLGDTNTQFNGVPPTTPRGVTARAALSMWRPASEQAMRVLSKLSRTQPQVLGRFADVITGAVNRGGLPAVMWGLSGDEEFRGMMDAINENDEQGEQQ